MKKQELTKDIIVCKKDICDQGNEYTYIMTARESSLVASFGIMLYSIRIEMTDFSGNKTSAEICDVFSNKEKADIFFNKLVRNLATPINLVYVLEDEIF